jgi:hypothetical protein
MLFRRLLPMQDQDEKEKSTSAAAKKKGPAK